MVFLSCACGEDTYKVFNFSFRIFLRRFYIIIDLSNSESDLSSWYASTPLPSRADMEVELTSDSGQESKQKNTGNASFEYPFKTSIGASAEEELSKSSKKTLTIKYKDAVDRVSVSGSPSNVRWEVRKLPHEAFIEGIVFKDEKMLNAKSSSIGSASISVNVPRDGVFLSPKNAKNIGETRMMAIFSLVMRREICEQNHAIEDIII